MPAIITHHLFGESLLKAHPHYANTPAERDAFLLGCQGPDPFFYLRMHPKGAVWKQLGSILHKEKTAELLGAFDGIVNELDEQFQGRAQAFARGFLAHYALDSQVHPLVYAQQYALCNADEPGLEARDGSPVHGVIETTIDEAVLFGTKGYSVRWWKPYEHILQASDDTLRIVSLVVARLVKHVYQIEPDSNVYATAVKSFRLMQRAFFAPGPVRRVIARAERVVKRHSLFDAMCHRATLSATCAFDNHEHAVWVNPFTKEESTLSVADLTQRAFDQVEHLVERFDAGALDNHAVREISGGVDFSGEPA